MSSINFDNIYLLLVAIPIAVLLAVPFFWAVRKDNANAHNIASAVLHVLMALCIAFALAGTTVETTVTETDVYVLADVSFSAEKNLDAIDNYIDELKVNLPKNSKLGVVCFAKEQQLLVPLGKSVKSVKAADTDLLVDSETDIEGALDYASSLFRDGVIKRIVLMTDGKQTHVEDSNALKRAVDSVRAEGILVDAVYVDDNLSADAKEVQMISAVATQNTYEGKDEEAVVTVRSTYETKATVSLYRGTLQLSSQPVRLTKGNNSVSFDLDTSVQGTFEYEVRVDAEGDENSLNNNARFSQTVSDSVNVLLITEKEEDEAEFKERYYGKATLTAFAPDDDNIPLTVEDLCGYDEIIISNADMSKAAKCTMFLDNLNTVVSKFGKSLVTYGNVYTQDNESLTALANMLPVKYGNSDRDSKLYTIIVDASRSMETYSKFEIAKSASKQLIKKLSVNDWVCVVAFNGNYYTMFAPEAISDEDLSGEKSSRERALASIDAIEAEHGTVISFGLQEAYNLMKNLSFDKKQIMLISDGLSVDNQGEGESETTKITNILNDMKNNRISVSVIDVGRGGDTSSTEALNAQKLLNDATNMTNGKYTLVTNVEEISGDLFGEGIIDDLTEVVMDDENANVVTSRSSDAALRGVTFNTTDYVTGFVVSKAKSGSTTVLELSFDDRKIPLYNYWNYGKGKVASFTTALKHTKEWSNAVANPFFENLLSTNIPDEKADYPFVLETIEENGYIHLTATPAKMSSKAVVKITLTTPGETESAERITEISNMTFATSCYKFSFATYNLGKYEVVIDYIEEGRPSYSANYSYYVTYLPEYDSFASYDIATLYKMIGSEGKVMDTDDVIKIENDENMIASYELDLTFILLIICVVLFVADVIVRKIKWEDIRSLFGKGRK